MNKKQLARLRRELFLKIDRRVHKRDSPRIIIVDRTIAIAAGCQVNSASSVRSANNHFSEENVDAICSHYGFGRKFRQRLEILLNPDPSKRGRSRSRTLIPTKRKKAKDCRRVRIVKLPREARFIEVYVKGKVVTIRYRAK